MHTNFVPDWISPPGETIADILSEKGLSIEHLARKLDCANDETLRLLDGSLPLTRDLAELLSRAIGGSADFWLAREANYRTCLQANANKAHEDWLRNLPTRDMASLGWLSMSRDLPERIGQTLRFFGVSSFKTWQSTYESLVTSASFRASKTFQSDFGAVAAWLRQGEIEASRIACRGWNAERFRAALNEIRNLTKEKDPSVFIPHLQNICAQCGVAVVILRAPARCRASGATRFLMAEKALVLLSMRYLSDDHFWFSFFHEAGHLLVHSQEEVFLEIDGATSNGKEEQANRFAEDVLVPPEHRTEMLNLPLDGRTVMRFAKKIGIAPGLVVGQLQHVGRFERRQLNNLKRRYRWATS